MKKIFTLIAAVAFAASASAQVLTFTKFDKGAAPENITKEGLVLTITDTDGKLACDSNSAYFGTTSDYQKFETRLKTGGKSSSKNGLTLTLPADGTLKVYARTGKNADTDRNIVLTQDGTDLVDKVLLESDAVKATIEEVEKNVYPVISTAAKKGDVVITYPVNSINIYAIELTTGGETNGISKVYTYSATDNTFNLAGVKVANNAKGLIIKGGKKIVKK